MKSGITMRFSGGFVDVIQSRDPFRELLKISLEQQYNATVKDGPPPPSELPPLVERAIRKLTRNHRAKPIYCRLGKKSIWLSNEEEMELFQDPRVKKDVYIVKGSSAGEATLHVRFKDIPDYLLPKRKPSQQKKKRPPTRWWRTAATAMGAIEKLKRKRR